MKFKIIDVKRKRFHRFSNLDYWGIKVEDELGQTCWFNCTPGKNYNHYPTRVAGALKDDLMIKLRERFLCAEELLIGQEVEVES